MSVGIEFECPHCGRVTRVPAELARKQGRCAECRKILEVPDPDMEGSARRTSHLRHSDRAGFELASSTLEREPLPKAPSGQTPTLPVAWDFRRVPVWLWVMLGLGLVFPPLGLVAASGIVLGHRARVRELLVCGYGGFVPWLAYWLLFAITQHGLFALPALTIALLALVAIAHVKWVAKLPPDQRRSR